MPKQFLVSLVQMANGKTSTVTIDILHICIVLTLHSSMFRSFRLGIMHFSFLFALHKSLSGVGVSIGVLGVTCKHLGSKREWKVLFERVENRSGQ